MREILVLASMLLLFSVIAARADLPATRTNVGTGCTDYALCVSEADTGVCMDSGGTDEYVARLSDISNAVFFHDGSAGNWSCDIYVNSQGYDAASGSGDKINTSALTQANLAPATASGISGYVWASCGTISSSVTLTMRACPVR